jgi:aspartate/methionine/tyrosine aminotransferase
MSKLDSEIQKLWADRIQPQPMFDVLQRAHLQEQTGAYLARMEIGDTPGFQNAEMHRLLAKFAGEPFRYSPSSGEKRLKDAVFASQWPDFSENHMSTTIAPANFLITAAMASVSRPGDVIYLPDPGFPTYLLAANFLNLKIVYYSSLENLESTIRQRIEETRLMPRIVVLNNPSNPLGLAIEGSVFKELVNYLEESNVQLILDETYINLVYEEINPKIESNLAIRIRSFSKEHCSPGLRIGYALAPKNQSKVMSDFVSLSISCAPKFIQLAVAEYLESENAKSFTAEVRSEMKKRFEMLQDTIPKKSFLARPNSAFYALIRVEDDAEAFEFLMKRNVSTCPGSKFGRKSANCLRISLAGSAALFPKDLKMLKDALGEYLNP